MTNKKVLYFIQQAGSLLLMPRTHKRTLGTTFDTVASHSFHVAILAYTIARMEKLSSQQALEAMAMGLLHDLSEARTGDMDFPARMYTTVDESRAVKDQFAGISFGSDLENLIIEYETRKTEVSQCAKDADSLQQFYLEWVLTWQGNKIAEKWYKNDLKIRIPGMFTKSAKKLARLIKSSSPQEWWVEFVNADKIIRKSYGRG